MRQQSDWIQLIVNERQHNHQPNSSEWFIEKIETKPPNRSGFSDSEFTQSQSERKDKKKKKKRLSLEQQQQVQNVWINCDKNREL